MNGYIAIYEKRRAEIYAPTLYDAKQRAVTLLNVPHKKRHLIAILLAEKNGQPVIHNPAIL